MVRVDDAGTHPVCISVRRVRYKVDRYQVLKHTGWCGWGGARHNRIWASSAPPRSAHTAPENQKIRHHSIEKKKIRRPTIWQLWAAKKQKALVELERELLERIHVVHIPHLPMYSNQMLKLFLIIPKMKYHFIKNTQRWDTILQPKIRTKHKVPFYQKHHTMFPTIRHHLATAKKKTPVNQEFEPLERLHVVHTPHLRTQNTLPFYPPKCTNPPLNHKQESISPERRHHFTKNKMQFYQKHHTLCPTIRHQLAMAKK